MCDEIARFTFGDLDHAAGDDGARQRGAEEVDAFVDGVDLDGGCASGAERQRARARRCKRVIGRVSLPICLESLRSRSRLMLTIDQFGHKLPLQILQKELARTTFECLFPGRFKVFFLTDIRHKSDDFVALFDEPCEDA